MADTFLLELATPNRRLVNEPVEEAQIPAASGYLGVLPGHAPLLGQLGVGEMTYRLEGGKTITLVIAGGYVEVTGSHVRVLADAAEQPDEIDAERAQKALSRASERLSRIDSQVDVDRAIKAMRRAQSRLELIKKYGVMPVE